MSRDLQDNRLARPQDRGSKLWRKILFRVLIDLEDIGPKCLKFSACSRSKISFSTSAN